MHVRVCLHVCACVPLVNLSNKSCKQQQTNKPKANNTHTHTKPKKREEKSHKMWWCPRPSIRPSVSPSIRPRPKSRSHLVWAGHKNMSIIKSHAWEGQRHPREKEREREREREWHSHSPGKRHVNRKKGFQQNNTPSPQSLLPETSMWIGSRRRRRRKRKRSNGSGYVPTSAAAAPHLQARQWPKVMRILTMCQGQGH